MNGSKLFVTYLLLLFLCLLGSITACQNSVNKKSGNKATNGGIYIDTLIGPKDKAQILDVIRKLAQKKITDSVKFVIQTFIKRNNWALIQVKPAHTNGAPLNYHNTLLYRDTMYKDVIDADLFDDHILALLQQKDNNWQLVEYEFGATDYAAPYWIEQHGLSGIFK